MNVHTSVAKIYFMSLEEYAVLVKLKYALEKSQDNMAHPAVLKGKPPGEG